MKLTEEESEELAAGGDGGAAEEGVADYTTKSAGSAAAGTPSATSTGYEARALLDQVTDKVTTADIQSTIAGLSFTQYAEKNFNYDRKVTNLTRIVGCHVRINTCMSEHFEHLNI